MLENRDRWLFEFADQVRRRANIENVIKRKLFAVKFFKIFVKIAVERGGLMRIFSVTKTSNQRQRERKRRIGRLLCIQETADGPIVC